MGLLGEIKEAGGAHTPPILKGLKKWIMIRHLYGSKRRPPDEWPIKACNQFALKQDIFKNPTDTKILQR